MITQRRTVEMFLSCGESIARAGLCRIITGKACLLVSYRPLALAPYFPEALGQKRSGSYLGWAQ